MMRPLLAVVLLALPVPIMAQGPSSIQFESLAESELPCATVCTSSAGQAQMSKGGKAILIGGAVGAGIGLLAGAVAYRLCANNDNSSLSCTGTALLSIGLFAGVGALIGGFIGAPGHPPATDAP